jgi:hypothetical protein
MLHVYKYAAVVLLELAKCWSKFLNEDVMQVVDCFVTSILVFESLIIGYICPSFPSGTMTYFGTYIWSESGEEFIGPE